MTDTSPRHIRLIKRDGAGETTAFPPEKIVSGPGQATIWNAFTDPSGRLHVGHWRAEPGIHTVTYRETEVCVILEGRIRLDAPDGKIEFGPGDAFVIEAGFLGTWQTLERVTKLYVVLDPDPDSAARL